TNKQIVSDLTRRLQYNKVSKDQTVQRGVTTQTTSNTQNTDQESKIQKIQTTSNATQTMTNDVETKRVKYTTTATSKQNVWIFGSTTRTGAISVYFGPNDKRNYAGHFRWPKPINKTR